MHDELNNGKSISPKVDIDSSRIRTFGGGENFGLVYVDIFHTKILQIIIGL